MDSPHSVRGHARFAYPMVIRWSLAVCGSALLVVGVSLPTVAYRAESGQLAATQSYFDDATGGASIIFVLAILVAISAFSSRRLPLRIVGAAVLGFVAVAFVCELSDPRLITVDPPVTMALTWGWTVLGMGALLAALSGWLVGARAKPTTAR